MILAKIPSTFIRNVSACFILGGTNDTWLAKNVGEAGYDAGCQIKAWRLVERLLRLTYPSSQ